MTSKYCDRCNHEKKDHIGHVYGCKVKGCKCASFERGPIRDVHGDAI